MVIITEALEKLSGSSDTSLTHVGGGTQSKKLDVPILGSVEQTGLADFRTRKESFIGHSNDLKLDDDAT